MYRRVVRDIVAVVAQRRRVKWQQPNRIDPQLLEIIQFPRQPTKIADAITIAVAKRAHVQLVDDRVLVPQALLPRRQTLQLFLSFRKHRAWLRRIDAPLSPSTER